MQIQRGPFAATEVPLHELVPLANGDGSTTEWWPVHNRTPVFLEVFRPEDGWSVQIRCEPGPFNLPDYRNAIGPEVAIQPTQLFIASLYKDDRMVNQASSLEVIDGPKAWERGETNARGRLYDALGLPGSTKPLLHQFVGQGLTASASTLPKVAVVPIERPAETEAPQATTSVTARAEPQAASEPPAANAGKTAPVASSPQTAVSTALNPNLTKQIEVQARIRGVQVPAFASNEEAKAFLKGLLTGQVAP